MLDITHKFRQPEAQEGQQACNDRRVGWLALLYGSEWWAAKKSKGHRMHVAGLCGECALVCVGVEGEEEFRKTG